MQCKTSGYIWINKKFILWEEAKIHIMTHTMHYASSVFEGIRSYNGKIFKLQEHSNRLIDSAKLLGMPINYTSNEIQDIITQTVKKNQLLNCYIRPLIWLNGEELKIYSKGLKTNFAVMCWKSLPKTQNFNLIISKWKKFHPSTFPVNCKAGATYSMMTQIKKSALENGYSDALLLDINNNIAETTCSNIFFVKNNILYSPLKTNILNGITRQTIINIAKSNKINVIEKNITIKEMKDFDECFLTGTAISVRPVNNIAYNKENFDFTNHKLTKYFITEYKKLITDEK